MGGRVVRIVTRLNRGGPLRQLTALVPALADLGWDGPVIVGRTEPHEPDGADDLAAAGARVVRLPSLARGVDPARDGRALRQLLRAVRRERPHVVHTHLAKAGALGRIAAWTARVPAVHTFHGHHLQAPWPRDRLACLAERTLAPLTAAATCLTRRQRRDLCDVHRPLASAKVHVIGPTLDVEAFRRRADAPRVAQVRRLYGAPDRPLFLWAGRFVDVKDPLAMLRAVRASKRRFRLVMLGAGPLLEPARAYVAAEGLAATVMLPGPTADTAPWIAAADLVVLSSRSEGAPLLVVEAKALGTPALVTAVGGVPDLVRHGVDGWWVPPSSTRELARALDDLAADAELRARLGAAAAEGVGERFAPARVAAEVAALYESLRRGGPDARAGGAAPE